MLGSPLSTTVAAGASAQTNDVFNAAGVGQCDVGHALVEIASGQGPIWSYASVIDNTTGDPITIPQTVW